MVGWRAYYVGDRIFDSRANRWEDLPADGLLIVVLFEERTYRIYVEPQWQVHHYTSLLFGQDYYWIGSDGVPVAGSAREAAEVNPLYPKRGVTVQDDVWRNVYNRAYQDVVF